MRRLRIRRMDVTDINFVLELANKNKELWMDNKVRFPFNKKRLKEWVKDQVENELLILELSGKPIGFSMTSVDKDTATILSFAIIKEERGKGYGKFFFKELLKRLKKQGIKRFLVYVHEDNRKAMRFYKKFGFKKAKKVVPLYLGKWFT